MRSEAVHQPQNIICSSVGFNSSDDYKVWGVAPTSNGTNLTAGTRIFTAAGGTLVAGGLGAASWSMPAVSDGSNVFVAGTPSIISMGQYKSGSGPTPVANAPSVDLGSNNSTYALLVGIVKKIIEATTEQGIVVALNAVNSDPTNSRVVTVLRQEPGSNEINPIAHRIVPANAGIGGDVDSCDLLAKIPGAARDANNKAIIKLAPGVKLYVTVPLIAASQFMRVNCTYEDFTVTP